MREAPIERHEHSQMNSLTLFEVSSAMTIEVQLIITTLLSSISTKNYFRLKSVLIMASESLSSKSELKRRLS